MEIEAVAVALNGNDDAREGRSVRGNLLEHLPEGLPSRRAQKAKVLRVVFEDGAQELGNGEDIVGVADSLEDAAGSDYRANQSNRSALATHVAGVVGYAVFGCRRRSSASTFSARKTLSRDW